ncbi:NDxxF motif lipoprotein [Staphylococcus condimenti]|uniref:NDxxF motif lipoprotein n=1 Tax=Staphylococcus condimenti TaxID=70255 RepID=A0AB37HA28_9STAP|nr:MULTISPECIES: NDxxF motif lipoprotein [Staphylococcus]AMY06165.1 hypothetical protein A4G25_09615 [Staphylococcus condimenti]MDK8645251.1 NDxxF motif lipoprotein [Staphylococcus condimenti]OFO99480.1 hypothetical protein HMPREF3007_12500 [Staphylococcus sp. HMSC065E08]PNZ63826.1 NDxxF motif lipoprotein [Staphylococcus condimenti]QQS82036.1 NDxxF motif lipoprotein [Staphylococcus condimenti]
MKQKLATLMACTLILSACSGSNEETDKEKEPQKKATQKQPTEKDTAKINLNPEIFKKQDKNKTISEAEMKRDIQQYLNADHDLTRITENYEDKMYSDEKLTKKEASQIKHASKLTDENDNNFSNYINQNKLPKGYDKYAHKISRYIMTSNQYLKDLEEKIDTAMDRAGKGKLTLKELEDLDIKNDAVNGKQQKVIEDWLKEKDIQTRAFKK